MAHWCLTSPHFFKDKPSWLFFIWTAFEMFSCWCKQMQHYCLIIPVWLFSTWISKVWFSESLCNKYLPYFQFEIGNGGHTTHQSLRCNKSLKYFSSSLWRAKILKYCSSTLFKARFIPESEIVNNVPLSMALRNAENRIMAPKSNIIVGNVEEHFIFLHCRKRTKKMYILI